MTHVTPKTIGIVHFSLMCIGSLKTMLETWSYYYDYFGIQILWQIRLQENDENMQDAVQKFWNQTFVSACL